MQLLRLLMITAGMFPLATGCFAYRTVAVDAVPLGTTVRARVSAEEAERLSQDLGREERLLEGPLLQRTDDRLTFEVTTAAAPDQTGTRFTQRVLVPRRSILELETRQFDKRRTVLAAVAGAAVVGVLLSQAFKGTDSPNGDGKGGPDQRRARAGIIIPLAPR